MNPPTAMTMSTHTKVSLDSAADDTDIWVRVFRTNVGLLVIEGESKGFEPVSLANRVKLPCRSLSPPFLPEIS